MLVGVVCVVAGCGYWLFVVVVVDLLSFAAVVCGCRLLVLVVAYVVGVCCCRRVVLSCVVCVSFVYCRRMVCCWSLMFAVARCLLLCVAVR